MEPDAGVEYPLQLGATLLGRLGGQGAAADEYCTLRYDFKPASAGRAAAGQMDVEPGSQKVSLQMGEAAFAGKYEPSKGDGLDCVAIWDGTSFRLELLGATVKNLRHVGGGRNTAPARGTAQPPAAAAAAAVQWAAEQSMAEAEGGEAAMDCGLEDELLRALEAGDDEEEEGAGAEEEMDTEEAGRAAAPAPDEAELAAGAGEEAEEEADEELSSSSEEEEEEEEEDQQQQSQQQQGAAPALQQQQQPLIPHAPVAREEMNDLDLMFFGMDGEGEARSPEPPAQQQETEEGGANGGGGSSSSSGDEEGGSGAASEPEQEEI